MLELGYAWAIVEADTEAYSIFGTNNHSQVQELIKCWKPTSRLPQPGGRIRGVVFQDYQDYPGEPIPSI